MGCLALAPPILVLPCQALQPSWRPSKLQQYALRMGKGSLESLLQLVPAMGTCLKATVEGMEADINKLVRCHDRNHDCAYYGSS
jgi:hypothetical protein